MSELEPLSERQTRRAKIEEYAKNYPAVIMERSGRLTATCPAFDELSFTTSTAEEAFSLLRKEVADRIELLLDRGCVPPMPGSGGTADAQVNMRLTPDEKRRIQLAALRCGYHSMSEFVRDAAHAGVIETQTGIRVEIRSSRKVLRRLVR